MSERLSNPPSEAFVSEKRKFVEILLLVASIIAALAIPEKLVFILATLLIFAIYYYWYVGKHFDRITKFLAFMVSATFSGVISYFLGVSSQKALGFGLATTLLTTLTYYFVLTAGLYLALVADEAKE